MITYPQKSESIEVSKSEYNNLIGGISSILSTMEDSRSYNLRPPVGPPTEYPTLSSEELDMLKRTAYGQLLGKDSAYSHIKLLENRLEPINVDMPDSQSLDGKSIWAIDGSNKSLDYSAFHVLLSRASIVEFMYSKEDQDNYHSISQIDRSGVCMIDRNIFKDDIHLFGKSQRNLQQKRESSWIDILESKDPLIVSFDPATTDKKPSSHAQGWCVKIMHTLELMALSRIPKEKSGIVIRDGPLLPVAATMKDTQRAMSGVLNWENKILICVSKRIQESTLFVEFLTNPQNEKHMEFYFPDQKISKKILEKLPADYLLLPKILEPGQRTPLIEAVPKNRAPIVKKKPELTPVSCYYMRRRAPHSVIRIEFPKEYFLEFPDYLDWAISCIAWQHELGKKVPQVQEFADMKCQLKSEIRILQNVARGELLRKGLETLEVYE